MRSQDRFILESKSNNISKEKYVILFRKYKDRVPVFWVVYYRRGDNAAAAAAKSLQLCPTLCSPIDGSPPGSSVPGVLQARTLEWVAISFSNA